MTTPTQFNPPNVACCTNLIHGLVAMHNIKSVQHAKTGRPSDNFVVQPIEFCPWCGKKQTVPVNL